MWKRTDGIALYGTKYDDIRRTAYFLVFKELPPGFVAENGDLELRNVNAKDTGNYTCVVTYTGSDNEDPVEAAYEVRLRGKNSSISREFP